MGVTHLRYIPIVAKRTGGVILVMPPELKRLARSVSGVSQVVTHQDHVHLRRYQTALICSLPHLCRTATPDHIPCKIPYLKADAASWASVLAGLPGLKIGLCWAGQNRPNNLAWAAIDRRRSMKLTDMAPLLDVPGCSFVSLQVGPAADQIRDFPRVLNVTHRLADFADTANLIAGLDLVVSVDTAVVHLAGALGKPVWLLNRHDSCWRWFHNRSDSPWYLSMRIFRQPKIGDWTPIIAEAVATLS